VIFSGRRYIVLAFVGKPRCNGYPCGSATREESRGKCSATTHFRLLPFSDEAAATYRSSLPKLALTSCGIEVSRLSTYPASSSHGSLHDQATFSCNLSSNDFVLVLLSSQLLTLSLVLNPVYTIQSLSWPISLFCILSISPTSQRYECLPV
jgi:hypothetical protein